MFASVGQVLAEKVIDEKGVINKIAFKKSAWFHGDAVGPFEAEALEEWWSLADFAGVKSESGPDAEIDARW